MLIPFRSQSHSSVTILPAGGDVARQEVVSALDPLVLTQDASRTDAELVDGAKDLRVHADVVVILRSSRCWRAGKSKSLRASSAAPLTPKGQKAAIDVSGLPGGPVARKGRAETKQTRSPKRSAAARRRHGQRQGHTGEACRRGASWGKWGTRKATDNPATQVIAARMLERFFSERHHLDDKIELEPLCSGRPRAGRPGRPGWTRWARRWCRRRGH